MTGKEDKKTPLHLCLHNELVQQNVSCGIILECNCKKTGIEHRQHFRKERQEN